MTTTIPKHSPWGHPQDRSPVAEGIVFFSTASHGGYWLSAKRRAAMPYQLKAFKTFAGGNWFEEDCDAIVVVLAFPTEFSADAVSIAWDMIRANAKYYEGRGVDLKRNTPFPSHCHA